MRSTLYDVLSIAGMRGCDSCSKQPILLCLYLYIHSARLVKPIVDKVKACLHDRFSHRRVLEVILRKYDKASKNVERS